MEPGEARALLVRHEALQDDRGHLALARLQQDAPAVEAQKITKLLQPAGKATREQDAHITEFVESNHGRCTGTSVNTILGFYNEHLASELQLGFITVENANDRRIATYSTIDRLMKAMGDRNPLKKPESAEPKAKEKKRGAVQNPDMVNMEVLKSCVKANKENAHLRTANAKLEKANEDANLAVGRVNAKAQAESEARVKAEQSHAELEMKYEQLLQKTKDAEKKASLEKDRRKLAEFNLSSERGLREIYEKELSKCQKELSKSQKEVEDTNKRYICELERRVLAERNAILDDSSEEDGEEAVSPGPSL